MIETPCTVSTANLLRYATDYLSRIESNHDLVYVKILRSLI